MIHISKGCVDLIDVYKRQVLIRSVRYAFNLDWSIYLAHSIKSYLPLTLVNTRSKMCKVTAIHELFFFVMPHQDFDKLTTGNKEFN